MISSKFNDACRLERGECHPVRRIKVLDRLDTPISVA